MSLAPWHVPAWKRIVARRQAGTMPHALLLCGSAGLGKRAFAADLAHALLCENVSHDGTACAKCRACQLIAAGSHPDYVLITFGLRDDGKPRTEIVVDQIRGLGSRVAMTAQFGGFQIAQIDPADAMNPAAGNALLKTLEEPTPATVIILIADQPARLPATIRSRCQRIDFHVPSLDQALQWLGAQAIEPKPARAALQASSGNPGLALTWLRAGGMALREEVIADLRALQSGRKAAVDVANRWSKSEPDARLWFVAELAAAQARAQSRGQAGPLALTAPAELPKLAAWFAQANAARNHLRGPLRPELVLLDALANWGDEA